MSEYTLSEIKQTDRRANRLMVWTSIFAFALCIVVRLIVVLALGIA